VHFRRLRSFAALAIATALFGVASTAGAGPKDKDAQKLFDSAINEDYLMAEFAKAEKKLKDAITKCGPDCTPALLGKINVALGTVYGVGLSKPSEAKEAFIAALKADPKAALDPSLTTPELQKIFDEAKKSAGGSGSSGGKTPQPSGDANHTAPAESVVNTPLPLYVEPSEEVPLSKVTVRYKPFGATQYKSVEAKKMGKGYGAEVPCGELSTTGDLKYFFVFTGSDGEGAGGLGSNKEPFRTAIKNDIEGDAPKFPGQKPPKKCGDVRGTCPPDMPGGCGETGGPNQSGPAPVVRTGEKGWKATCSETAECKEPFICLNGTCEEGDGKTGGNDGPKKRMNLVSVGVQFDLLNIKGIDRVCSADNADAASYACFLQGTSHQFFGKPAAVGNTNGIQGGFAYADLRVIAGYDRQLSKSVGISLGARVGFAIGGSPTPDNVPANASGALPFLPVHAEVRATYHIMGSMMDDKKFRPYVFVAPIGFAQVNAAVPVTVCDLNAPAAGETLPACPNGQGHQRQLNAYQITGRNFSGFGVGTTFGITPFFGFYAEAKVMFMWPTFGVVIAPTVGPAFAF
jgi:hypothetical protein